MGLEVLRTAFWQCMSRARPQQALQVLAAAISHCGEMMRGERGRPRAAYKVQAGEILHRAMHVPVPEPAGSSLRMQLLQLYVRETGAHPDCEHVLSAIAATKPEDMSAAVKDELRVMLEGCEDQEHAHHAQVLRHATMLRRVDDQDGAVEQLDRHIESLSATASHEAAQARFLRGTCRVAQGQLQAALEDMRFAAAEMGSDEDRANAAEIVAKLARHLSAATPQA